MPNKLLEFIKKPKLLSRIWKKVLSYFFVEQWIILAAQNSKAYKNFQWNDFNPIAPPPDRDWADPFPWFYKGKYYLFIEEKLYSTNLGRIICLTLDENQQIESRHIIIEKNYHLSYPFLFEYQGQLYMVPESNGNNTVDLYKCTEFPGTWEYVKTLLSDIKAVDATLLEKDGKWWLFANIRENGGSSWDSLHLFMADNPLSDRWVPHPKNPIVKDVSRARPAGRFIQANGELIRPSQDCSIRYGYATQFNRVTVLSESDYQEMGTHTFKPLDKSKYLSTHTWNDTNGLVMIDAILYRRRPIKIWNK